MENHRRERIEEAKHRPEALTDREHMLLARNVTDRIVSALEGAGYRAPQDIEREADVDRLAIRTGLGTQKAAEVKEGIAEYLTNDYEAVKAAQRDARAKHEAELAANAPEDAGDGVQPSPPTGE
ncbi:MAG: hypothetical protein AB7S26_41015 [Sandaracinaceae bacterium]